MATIYDVARRAGVSTYTVSSVINRSAPVSRELTERVLKAVSELSYTPNALARSLQTRRSHTIGMLIPNIGNPFYALVVRGVEDRLRTAGYTLLLGNTYDQVSEQARYLASFRSRQVDGYLLFVAADGEQEPQEMVQGRRPVVFVGRTPRTFTADTVSADNVLGTKLAVEHLIAQGHRRIGIVVGQLSLSTSVDRIEAWRECLRSHGLSAPESFVVAADWTSDGGYEPIKPLLASTSRPTALFAANIPMMIGTLRAAREAGLRVPEDLQVANSDDSEFLDVFGPPVSTVVQPSYDMGVRAADLLLKRIDDPERGFEQVVLEPTLRMRP